MEEQRERAGDLPRRPYHAIDFAAVDTIGIVRHVHAVESSTAKLLIDLWGEMLVRSRYEETRVISTGGVTYTYGTRLQGLGIVTAHSRNPEAHTPAGALGRLAEILETVTRAPTTATADSLLPRATDEARQLMNRLLEGGGRTSGAWAVQEFPYGVHRPHS